METKRFAKNDAGVVCARCGAEVRPLGYSSRNHCPFCLWSLHVDNFPGDRSCSCGGLMEPVGALPDPKKGYIIIHRCIKCGALRRCRAAHDAKIQPDDIGLIIKLPAGEQPDK